MLFLSVSLIFKSHENVLFCLKGKINFIKSKEGDTAMKIKKMKSGQHTLSLVQSMQRAPCNSVAVFSLLESYAEMESYSLPSISLFRAPKCVQGF